LFCPFDLGFVLFLLLEDRGSMPFGAWWEDDIIYLEEEE